jgi:membrane protein YdbS with pleckstrin-like domain
MFCIKCGSAMSDQAEFCPRCGFAAENGDGDEVTKLAAHSMHRPQQTTGYRPQAQIINSGKDEDYVEERIFSIRPTALFINIGYVVALLVGIGLVAALALLGMPLSLWWLSVLVGLSPLLVPSYHHLMRNMVLYTLTDSKIEIDEGFISRTTRNIPLGKIQDVTVKASMAQRMLGFGNLVIENAGETTGSIVLKNISSPRTYADLLLKQLRRLHRADL